MNSRLSRLLTPRSVAVVGASPRPGSVAGEVLRNLRNCGYSGGLYAVNPKYDSVDETPCVHSVGELPESPDLCVLAINRDLVLDAVRACGDRGIHNLVIITAGFKEIGEEGAARERELRKLINQYGLNVVGPNCMGIIHSAPDIRLNASFSRWFPSGGEVAFVSQSGSLGETLLECFEDARLGVSLFINLGNRAGLSENDFLEYLEDRATCRAVFLYLESFAEPVGFRSLVERISSVKPVVVLKAGRTEAGAAAVASHTGSLASADAVVDAFLRQSGAIRVTTIEETLTALRALERGVLPRGRRTAIVTNAGGAGIIAADACERVGIDVPTLNETTRQALASFLPAEAGLGNPVDMIATAGSADYERSLSTILPTVDSAIVVFRPPLVLAEPAVAVADGIVRSAEAYGDKPVVVCTLSRDVSPVVERLRASRIPTYAMPETGVEALSVLLRAAHGDQAAVPTAMQEQSTSDEACSIIRRARAEGRTGLYFDEGARLLAEYGIPVCPYAAVSNENAAVAFARIHGYPLVVKADAPTLFHRFEHGAVITGIETEAELRGAVERIRRVLEEIAGGEGRVLVQQTLEGRELIFGLERDPAFGPVVMFGIGGTFVEALKDVAFGVAPISRTAAEQLVRSIRSFPLLEAFRGQPAVDVAGLAELVVSLGELGLAHPEIEEIDLNPVFASDTGHAAVDILVRLRRDETSYRSTDTADSTSAETE